MKSYNMNISVNGQAICQMALAPKPGFQNLFLMKVNFKRVENTALGNIEIQINGFMKEIS